ncbi:MAG: putative lipid II flippase FtsW [Defluviitaleaceae bacterium]|nr:putative lipid II flippase FtsW [Defluviitaleaceae bacterium]
MSYPGTAKALNRSERYGKRNAFNNRRRQNNSKDEPASEIRKRPEIRIGRVDHALVFIITLLVFLGFVMVFTSSIYIAENAFGDMYHFLRRQTLFIVMGFTAMFIMSTVSYQYLRRFVVPLYLVANALLIVVQVIGIAYGGATRQLQVGGFVGQFQPLEIAKVSTILIMALILSNNKDLLKKWSGFFIACSIVMVTVALMLRGGLSSSIITAMAGFGIIFIASPHVMRFVALGAAGVAGITGFILFAAQFRMERIQSWLDPFSDTSGASYQIAQSLFSIASGGIFGLGIGQSRQRSFLPLAHNDFIFAIICEELGLFGASVVLLLFGMLIWRGINIALKAPDAFGSYIAAGIVILIGSQTIINVAVVTNSIPNTGITMPLISYGGTSFLITMFLMGILLNISRFSKS